jgi:hypothetical protein
MSRSPRYHAAWLVVGGKFGHGWLKDWTKVQHGKCTFELYLKMTPTKRRTKKQP